MTPAAELIAIERDRQIQDEGWTAEHDAEHKGGDLVAAAECYLRAAQGQLPAAIMSGALAPVGWPWEPDAWKPGPDAVRNYVKAGALIAAEVDRLLGPREGVTP